MNNEKNVNADVKEKEHEKKSIKNLLIFALCSFIVGGVLGFFFVMVSEKTSADLFETIKTIVDFDTRIKILPWVLLVFTVPCSIIQLVRVRQAEKQFAIWDGEDEKHVNEGEKYLNKGLSSSNYMSVIVSIIFAVSTYDLIKIDKSNLSMLFFLVVVYIFSLFINIYMQAKIVNSIKKIQPEKRGSAYDIKFKDKWLESLDEAEKHLTFEVAHNTVQTMTNIFLVALTIATLIGMFIPIGLLCAVIIGGLWLIMIFVYHSNCNKLNKEKCE